MFHLFSNKSDLEMTRLGDSGPNDDFKEIYGKGNHYNREMANCLKRILKHQDLCSGETEQAVCVSIKMLYNRV